MTENDIERLFDCCSPARPSADLDARMALVFDEAERRAEVTARRRVPIWACVAACAACALLGIAMPRRWLPQRRESHGQALNGAPAAAKGAADASDRATPAAMPVRLVQKRARLSYDGIVAPDSQTPLIRLRRERIEQVEWTDPVWGQRMEWLVPREDVILIKATTY